MTVFLCESGFDGILSGVYDVYASRLGLENCRLELREEYEPKLFCDYRELTLDPEKAEKVGRTIREKISEEAYVRLYRAAMHKSPERADWILRFIAFGLVNGRRTLSALQNPAVYEIMQMDRYVGNEAHFHDEFIRFERLQSGLFFGTIGPENDVLALNADHFADRFPDMNWALYDEKRRKAAFHSEQGALVIYAGVTDEELDSLKGEENTDIYVDLWKTFFNTIAIEERKNPRCQQNMLPLRYRKYMTEWKD